MSYLLCSSSEPRFQPFVGRDYWKPTRFPGRLLVLGESHYLNPEDDHARFTHDILVHVAGDKWMRKWRTRYFRNLFYVLTGERWRTADQAEWEAVWNSLAFYNFAQTARLTRPLMRPTAWEWEQSISPFRTVIARLRPEFILITGHAVSSYVTRNSTTREGVVGVWIQTTGNDFAFARCIYHPSSFRFLSKRQEQRELVVRMWSERSRYPTESTRHSGR